MKIITFGGATRDIFIHYENAQTVEWSSKEEIKLFLLLQEGAKVEIKTVEYATGGGATNSATSFKRLGFDVITVLKVGNDEQGSIILAELEQEGIDIRHCKRSSMPTGISYIIPAPDGDNTVLAFRGVNAHMTAEEIPFDTIKGTDALYITSLSGQSSKLLLPVAQFAKEHKMLVANNPGISQLSAGIDILQTALPYIDIFILNSSEAQQLMNALSQIMRTDQHHAKLSPYKNLPLPSLLTTPWHCKNICFSLIQYFKTVEQLGPKIIVVTDGAHGVYIYAQGTIYYHPSLPITLINTLGAGDAFGSCFVASLLHDNTVEQAIIHGLLNSTSVISHLEAKTGLLTLDELKEQAKKVGFSLLQKFTI